MKAQDLEIVLQQHQLWIDSGEKEGSRADLSGQDLRDANLRDAYLSGNWLRPTLLKQVVI
jgi:uncharacterized protein YjbI with pentapeptide repeats